MFIVKKKIKGKNYYYLRESKREKGKVKAVTIAYLGKTKKGAENRMKEIEEGGAGKREVKGEGVKITYFVHGTTKDNEKGISTGHAHGELSELGARQSKELSAQVKNKKFDVVFCSDLKRAVDSAEISFKKHKIIQDKRLRECNYGDLNQAKEEEVVYSEHIDKKFPNGESLRDVEKRISDFINFLSSQYQGKHVAVVAHKAPQLALEVLTKGKSWKQAINEDWRKKGKWQPGWDYEIEDKAKEIKTKKQREVMVKQVKGSKLDEITSIASRRGFFFQTAEIYGGRAGFFTYGHLGKKLKNKFEELWRKHIIGLSDDFFEIQSNNILPEPVFEASGHIENFNDPMTECKNCKFRFRADQFLEDKGVGGAEALSIEEMTKLINQGGLKCPKCGGQLGEVRWFNMMFSVPIGFDKEKGYLSPETAQAAYLLFKQEFESTRRKLPLGIAIIDKAYRNEISPRQMFFRLREFTQAELQIFFDPEKINEHSEWDNVKKKKLRVKLASKEDIEEISCEDANKKLKLPKFYLYHAAKIQEFYLSILGIPKEKFRFRELSEGERAFYNKIHFDIELDLETIGGFKEVAGLHYRTDHDLSGHQKISGKNLEVFYDNKKILPHVLELSFGVDRNVWSLLDIFYGEGKEGSMFKFPSQLTPFQVAVLPLVNKEGIDKLAEKVYKGLEGFDKFYDSSGSIGRRYARQDEIGTSFAITIDGESLKKKDVTIRRRDDQKQIRVKIEKLNDILRKLINGEIEFEKAGRLLK